MITTGSKDFAKYKDPYMLILGVKPEDAGDEPVEWTPEMEALERAYVETLQRK